MEKCLFVIVDGSNHGGEVAIGIRPQAEKFNLKILKIFSLNYILRLVGLIKSILALITVIQSNLFTYVGLKCTKVKGAIKTFLK